MENVKAFGLLVAVALGTLIIAVMFAFTVASLSTERTINKVQVTVEYNKVLTTVQEVQAFCNCVAEAKPLGVDKGIPKYWRITAKYF